MLTIHGGFLGILNPSRTKLAYGHGVVKVYDLPNGGNEQHFGAGAPSGWKDDTTLAVSEDVLVNGQAERRLVWLDVVSGQRTDTGIPTNQLPGYMPQVAVMGDSLGDSIISSLPGRHFFYGVERQCEPDANTIEKRTAHVYAYKLRSGAWPTIVRHVVTSSLIRRVDASLSDMGIFDLSDGVWVGGNVPGGCEIHAPSGNVYRMQGEYFGAITEDPQNAIVFWTVTNEGWTPVVLGRELIHFRPDGPAYVVRGVGTDGLSITVTA